MHFERFSDNGNEKGRRKMNKPIYVGQAILYINKTLMYEFW